MDEWKLSRVKSCLIFGLTVLNFSLPCILGFNIWSGFKPFGGNSNILDLEDFIVSDNLLPLGAFMLTIFCMNRWGWRGNGFNRELAKGNGIKLHGIMIFYIRWILPLIILAIWIIGLIKKFCPHWLA
jgi:NSS family neurotransmitter:Na+ symporter